MIRRNKLFDVLRFVVADFASVKKKFIEQGEEEAEVEKYLKMFKELRDSQKIREIEDKNIDNWGKKPFTQLVEFVESLVDLPTEIRQLKQKNIKGAKLVAENEEWYVYEISQYEASKHLADGAGWCIKHESHWRDYTVKQKINSDFYFLISKTRSNEKTTRDPPLYVDKWKKIALQIDETGSITYWDVPDTSHTSLPPEVSSTLPKFTPVFSGRITIDGEKSRLDSVKEIPEGSLVDKIDAGVLKKLKEIPENIKVGIIDLNGTDIEKIPPIACQKLYLNFPECKVKEIPEDVDITELYLDKSPDIVLPKGLIVDIISLVNSKVSKLPEHMKVKGILDLSSSVIDEIPAGLEVNSLYLNKLIKKIPSGTKIHKNLDLSLAEDVELPDSLCLDSIKDVSKLSKLPNGLVIRNDDLDLSGSKIKELPENLSVFGELKIPKGISHLPPWLRAGKLDLQNSDVVSLEWNTKVNQLNINNTKIKELPLHKSYLYLSLRNTPIEEIPEELKSVGFLDIRGTKIEKIPDSLKNVSTMYINDKIISLPETLSVEKRVYAREGQLQVIPEHLASKVMEIY